MCRANAWVAFEVPPLPAIRPLGCAPAPSQRPLGVQRMPSCGRMSCAGSLAAPPALTLPWDYVAAIAPCKRLWRVGAGKGSSFQIAYSLTRDANTSKPVLVGALVVQDYAAVNGKGWVAMAFPSSNTSNDMIGALPGFKALGSAGGAL